MRVYNFRKTVSERSQIMRKEQTGSAQTEKDEQTIIDMINDLYNQS